jgi:Fic family protein
MGRKPYRVELNYSHGRPAYFLVRDVRIADKRRKTRKYIGHNPPTAKELDGFRQNFAYEIEMRAARKKAEMSCSLYKAEYLSLDQMKEIETIRFMYKTLTELLTTSEIEVYERNFEVNYVQGTTSIEGNTLSLKQAHDLLVNGLTPKNKSLREINEVQNFKRVKTYRDKYKGKITDDFVRTLHSLIMNNIDIEGAGAFRRTDDVGIQGCDLQVTPAVLIESELNRIIKRYYAKLGDNWYPFEIAVMFHYYFEMIHPFADGNGRVGREILNYMLKRTGYPRLLFLGSDRNSYINSLQLGNENLYSEMIQISFDLIYKQRYEILTENLKKVVIPPQKSAQRLLSDFML